LPGKRGRFGWGRGLARFGLRFALLVPSAFHPFVVVARGGEAGCEDEGAAEAGGGLGERVGAGKGRPGVVGEARPHVRRLRQGGGLVEGGGGLGELALGVAGEAEVVPQRRTDRPRLAFGGREAGLELGGGPGCVACFEKAEAASPLGGAVGEGGEEAQREDEGAAGHGGEWVGVRAG